MDPLHPRLREILDTPPSGPLLSAAPRVHPHPAMDAAVQRALAVAKQCGLRLTGLRGIQYVEAPGQRFGEAVTLEDGTAEVVLNVAMPPQEWARCTLHELQHVADRHLALPRADLEQRAILFAAEVMRRWWHLLDPVGA